MKAKKRLFAGMLALAMLFSLNVTAFASEPSDGGTVSVSAGPVENVTLTKTYKLANADTTSPAETFTYTISRVSVTDAADGITNSNMPLPTGTWEVNYNEGEATVEGVEKTFVVKLPEYTSVGIYTYNIHENSSNNAGVVVDSHDVTMNVTVVNGDDGFDCYVALYKDVMENGEFVNKKINAKDAFENTYEANKLTFNKDVQGNLAVPSKDFEFTITLTAADGVVYADSYDIVNVSSGAVLDAITVSGTKVINVSEEDGDIAIKNLPYGVTYKIEETNAYDYEKGTVPANAEGAINETAQKVTFINTKGAGTIDTGVYLDNLPYIIVFAGVLAAVAVLVIRRRRVDD